MKKIIAVLLVVSMTLLLIGCGAKREGDVVLKREYSQTKDGKYEFDGRTFDYKATVENGSTEFTVLAKVRIRGSCRFRKAIFFFLPFSYRDNARLHR